MAFEDSMIDAGFHDEEEYLEHLMSEAENFWRKQKESDDIYYDEDGGEDENDLYPKEREGYKEWIKKNPLLKELFVAWLNIYYPSTIGSNDFIEAFLEWRRDIQYNTILVENYYGNYYPRLIKYFKWKVDNAIEEILRFPQIENFDYNCEPPEEFSNADLLIQKVLEFENWLSFKDYYNKWMIKATEKEKNQLYEEVKKSYFDNDVTTESIRRYILQKLDDEDVIQTNKDLVLRWFDNNPQLACKTIFEIECIYYKQIY